MTDSLLTILTILAALGCGLNAGVFFAFSTFVMPALAKLPPAQGIAVAALAVLAAWPSAGWLVLAGLLQPAGNLAVTMLANVPLNNRLATVVPDSVEGATVWADYLKRWTAWNHVRTLTALAAMALLVCLLP